MNARLSGPLKDSGKYYLKRAIKGNLRYTATT